MAETMQLNRGMAIDIAVGHSITLHPSNGAKRVVITVEAKSGQRSRIRIQSEDEVQIDPPRRKSG